MTSQYYQHQITQYQADDTHNQSSFHHVFLTDKAR